MLLFPAIDICDGRCVRLLRGDYSKKTVYDQSPVNVARRFISDGAKCLHIVDLNGAKNGVCENFDVIASILALKGAFAQVGGGIRDIDTVGRYIDTGASRVILGTAALEDRAFLERAVGIYKDKIAVGVDSRSGFVATRGWLETANVRTRDFMKDIERIGVSTVIYTDISRDGAMSGIDAQAYREMSESTSIDIIASGGITVLSDIQNLKAANVRGAILGRALYEGAFSLSDALKISEGE